MAMWIDGLLKTAQGNPEKTLERAKTNALKPFKKEQTQAVKRSLKPTRQLAGHLIEQVLNDELDCERALKRWPWKEGNNTPEAVGLQHQP